jgi:hypothetical protein
VRKTKEKCKEHPDDERKIRTATKITANVVVLFDHEQRLLR